MLSRPQLFCFPYAGGTAAFFDIIENDLEDIELVGLEYSGHGARHREPFYRNFDELADDMFQQLLLRYSGGAYGLFGYSMGSISLVEVLRKITDSNVKPPKNVFLAAHEPKVKTELSGFSKGEPDERVKERTIRFGDVPESLLNNRTFWRTYLPVYRADYSIIGKYAFDVLEWQTDIPVDIFYSETDTPLAEMAKWRNIFTGECHFDQFTGTHFFIREHHKEMGRIICDRLRTIE